MKLTKQHYILIVVLVFGILSALGIYIFQLKPKSQKPKEKESVFEKTPVAIPTVDSSVVVEIKGKTEAVIDITGIPDDTESIEYQLTYSTISGGEEGVLGQIDKIKNSTAKKNITFGTCSSGVCRYHDIDGPVVGVFKFSGTYGERLLEKNFDL